ncbi:unnamed protein product [Larinioides sclopetarius]|uniref:PE-PGRS protein n=1 Tax=Larinioides sclopetarius TaxID=280406 RepID=A0AAV1ZEH4_9ARAC
MLKIFALNKVFIDTDLSLASKGTSVSVIAPKWEVIGIRTIELHGEDGASHAASKARNGPYAGNNGANGAPGRPGGSGENFYRIGSIFVGGTNLKLNAKGGKGGPGQAGGDGAQGLDGKDSPKPAEKDPKCEGERFKGFTCGTLDYIEYDKIGYTIQWNYKIFGTRGGKGGNEGDGGKGGIGGDLGNIVTLELSRPSKIIKLASVGEEGNSGKGGAGRLGGKDGNHQLANFKKKIDALKCYFMFQCKHSTWWEPIGTEKIYSRGPDGSNGLDGRNDKGIEYPKSANSIRLTNVINDYKIYQQKT